jgi:hypothetical protein
MKATIGNVVPNTRVRPNSIPLLVALVLICVYLRASAVNFVPKPNCKHIPTANQFPKAVIRLYVRSSAANFAFKHNSPHSLPDNLLHLSDNSGPES